MDRNQIDSLLADLPREQGQLLPALHRVQHELGWLPREVFAPVAKHLKITEAQVYGPATYYAEFRISPPPERLVTWCSGPTCRVLGGDKVLRIMEAELGCELGGNSADGKTGLWLGQCNGSCERAPQVWVDGRVVGPLSLADSVRLARRIKAGEDVAPAPQGAVQIESTAVQVKAYHGAAGDDTGGHSASSAGER
jgi:NADH:ubiquinone oxidoreductase subunit E